MTEPEKTEDVAKSNEVGAEKESKSWLASLSKEQVAELTEFAKNIFKDERAQFDRELKAAKRETSKFRAASSLDEAGLAKLDDWEGLRQEAIELQVSRGVPEELLDFAKTPTDARKIAEAYLKNQTASVESRVAAALEKKPAAIPERTPATERVPMGSGQPVRPWTPPDTIEFKSDGSHVRKLMELVKNRTE